MELPHDHSPSIILLSPDGGNEIMRPTTVFGRAIGLLSNGKTNGSRTWFESKQNVVRVEAERGSNRSNYKKELRLATKTTPPPCQSRSRRGRESIYAPVARLHITALGPILHCLEHGTGAKANISFQA